VTLDRHGCYEFLLSRRSIRRFRDMPVAEQTLRRILTAACRAPSAHNRQPWRFVVIEGGEQREHLAREMSAHWRSDQQSQASLTPELEERIQSREARLVNAPVAVLLCMTMEEMPVHADDRQQWAERIMAMQSVALAGGHLLLAAHAEGLGAFWVGAALFAPQAIQQSLDLPSAWEPQGMILMGEPSDQGEDRGRKPLEEVVLWR
jgi:coenzyme F420-0:L-glutamate ligase/coenzyme F420-1:gamma-L-glutamate ligase